MLAKILAVSKIAGLLALLFLCVRLGILVGHIDKRVQETQSTVAKLNKVLDDVHSDQKQIHQTIKLFDIAAVDIDKSAIDQRFYFKVEVPALLADVHRVLNLTGNTISTLSGNQNRITDATVTVLNTANTQISEVGPVLEQAKVNLAQLQATEQDLNEVLLSPDITNTLHNISSTTAHLDGTTKDIQDTVHAIAHPKLATKIFNIVLKVGGALGRWF